MKTIKSVVMMIGLSSVLVMPAKAELNLFTQHQVIHMFRHGVNLNEDVRFPTGKLPYLGQIGLEYDFAPNFTGQVSYIHRSNVDIHGTPEYNYDGVSIGFKLKHCIAKCD